ncbi:PQQ-binding-like beta-propeller repeat protein [bacterium]|nr:PQQ-binding-like beta-propeller repeat protein [bacterium]
MIRLHPLPRFALIVIVSTACSLAADWPMYQADSARSGVAGDALAFPLALAWVYTPTHAPRPAWPEPGKELHRLDFDHAFQPVIADGIVYFGSSADDTVRALDARTGGTVWRYTTGGPVRFAPAIAHGNAYVTSDDGKLYCLDAKTGAAKWVFTAAPRADQLLGNGRMISRWPLRTGALVVSDTVYIAAGMWPAEGIYLYALNAETGDVVWKNDSSGELFRLQPHGGAAAFTGVCPQGYLLASGGVLLVPSGRSTPAAFDLRTGRLRYYQPYLYEVPYDPEGWGNRGNGGSWAVIAGEVFLNAARPGGGPEIGERVGEYEPDESDGLVVYGLEDGLRRATLQGKTRGIVSGGALFAAGNGALGAYMLDGWNRETMPEKKRIWHVPQSNAYCMAAAGNAVILGMRNAIAAHDTAAGTLLWRASVDGEVRGMAVAGGMLIAATDKGTLLCFTVDETGYAPPAIAAGEELAWDMGAQGSAIATARGIIRSSGVTKGYALVFSPVESRLAEALAAQTELQIIKVVPDAARMQQERSRLLSTDMYGTRLTVQALADGAALPFSPYCADLVVNERGDAVPPDELYRVTRPCGGVLCSTDAGAKEQLARCGAQAGELRTDGVMPLVVRGRLPGAGEWRYQWADPGRTGVGDEQNLRPPFEMLWFGGPGPDRMMSRHWGASPPLSVNGRVFMTGEKTVICFDAYTGRELWCQPLAGAGRKDVTDYSANIVADDDSVYVTVGAACYRFDQATGGRIAVYPLPEAARTSEKQVAPEDDAPFVDVSWPVDWTVFGPFPKGMATLTSAVLATIPQKITVDGTQYAPVSMHAVDGVVDFTYAFGGFGFEPLAPGEQPAPYPRGIYMNDRGMLERIAYAFARITVPHDGRLLAGAGADHWMQWFLDGKEISPELTGGKGIVIGGNIFEAPVTAGEHVLAVRVAAGSLGWCFTSLGGARYARQLSALMPAEQGPSWGCVLALDDAVIGGVVDAAGRQRGYTGRSVFSLDKATGATRWMYTAADQLLSHQIAAGDGRLFIVETTGVPKPSIFPKPGAAARITHEIVALDLASGTCLWRNADAPAGSYHPLQQLESYPLQYARGIVLAAGRAAYDAATGRQLWRNDAEYRGVPLIHGGQIIAQPFIYNLRTGEQRVEADPLAGEPQPWKFIRSYGCGAYAGCATFLFFRSSTIGFFDLETHGLTSYGGARPGCSVMMIPANGVFIVPESSSACTCSYNFQTSLGMITARDGRQAWYVFPGEKANRPPRAVRANFGAPGDRRDAAGAPWLGFPRPQVAGACPSPITILSDGHTFEFEPSVAETVSNAAAPWVYSSCIAGPATLVIDIAPQPVVAAKADAPPVLDGRLDDACWQAAPPARFEGRAGAIPPETRLFVARDADALYFGFERDHAVRNGKALPLHAGHCGAEDTQVFLDDNFGVALTDTGRVNSVELVASCSGGTLTILHPGGATLRSAPALTGRWSCAVSTNAASWSAEIAVPLAMLATAGVDAATLEINAIAKNLSGVGPEDTRLIALGSYLPVVNSAAPAPGRSYTLRLHFAEVDDAAPGSRVFDVFAQGAPILTSFDIAGKAGTPHAPIVEERKGIRGTNDITIELRPAAGSARPPVLSGLELIAEE